MAIAGIDPKCYILALFVRDDGVRFLLGDDPYEFKDKQLHFQPNTVANDVVEVQGNDGYLLAGQVRRPGTQSFDGYVCNGTNSKAEVEAKRREFLQFFRRSHFYKVIYVFPNGTAIQRKQGFLVDDPTVQELYQQYPEYHVALNFEDVNYYTYEEDDQGQEIYAKEAIVPLAGGGATGGLIWDEYGVVWEDQWNDLVSVSGSEMQIDNNAGARAPIQGLELQGDTIQNGTPTPDAPIAVQTVAGEQTVTVTGKNLWGAPAYATAENGISTVKNADGTYTISGTATAVWATTWSGTPRLLAPGTYTASISEAQPFRINVRFWDTSGTRHDYNISPGDTSVTVTTGYETVSIGGFVSGMTAGTSYNSTFSIQLEQGPTATAYEPYQWQTYSIDLRGKNLLNISDFAMGGLSNGNPVTASYRIQNADHPITVQPNTTYTLSAQLVSPVQGFRVGVHECRADGSFINDSGWKQLYVPNTFTTGPNTYFLKMVGSLSTTSTNVTTGDTENTTACATVAEFMRGCTLMLEKGSSATAYQPYNPIELCKIGDYQDEIFNNDPNADWYDPDLEDNAWYVHKEVRHLSKAITDMNNSENFPGWKNVSELTQDFPPATNINMNTLTDSWDNITGVNIKGSGRPIWGVNNLTNTLFANRNFFGSAWTQTYWKTNYPNLVLELYYGILNPITDTQITDATLVEQLEALEAMRLFIGENNLLVSATGTNLPATLEFSYPTKFAKIGAEWEEGGTKGATIVDVNAIDNTYPVWELMGPAVNPTISVLTTNTTLTYNGTITASQKLVIDMFNKTATLNGTSVIGNVSGDFVYMAPGTNRIAYTAGNTDAPDSTIYWQEVVG
jgi:hypothetical protein